jgi:Ca2+/Na+ antiporter
MLEGDSATENFGSFRISLIKIGGFILFAACCLLLFLLKEALSWWVLLLLLALPVYLFLE